MKPRRRKGATLGLVAVSVLVIIVIGVGCFFLAKICGGGREVTNATDAGVLNVAKEALRSQYVAVSPPVDFTSVGDPSANPAIQGKITMYTYNRAVAQALLVALNAQQENTGNAIGNASTVFGELQTIGTQLTALLNAQATLQGQFNLVANDNSLKMYGNNAMSEKAGGYQVAFMKTGGQTNIWFNPQEFPVSVAGLNLVPAGTVDKKPSMVGDPNAYQDKYMVGYQAITVPTVNLSFMGVPVFPQQTPHLVSLHDFNLALASPSAGTPPNAFSIQSQNLDSKSNTVGGAISCAIVGCATGGNSAKTDPVDFAGDIPGGYIEIANRSAANPPPGGWGSPTVFDDNNNIFNHELNSQGNEGDPMSIQSGGNFIFYDPNSSSQPCPNGSQAIQAWAAYNDPANASNATADPVSPATWTYPATPAPGTVNTGPPPIPSNLFVTQPGGGFAPATATDLEAMGANPVSKDCMSELNSPPYYPTSAACSGNSLGSMNSAFGRSTAGLPGSGGDTPQMWSLVDSVKSDIINAFNSGTIPATASATAGGPGGAGQSITFTGEPSQTQASGIGAYKVGLTDGQIEGMGPAAANYPWAANEGSAPLETLNPNAWDLLNQVMSNGPQSTNASCTMSTLLGDITQRCNEIFPGTSQAQVVTLLQSSPPLNMGVTLYICRQKATDPTSPLIITNVPPSTAVGGTQPDGNNAGGPSICDSGWYGLSGGSTVGGLIDAQSPNGFDAADDNLHDQPYMHQTGTVEAEDHADFVLSSGFQNLLGKLDFYQTVQGNDQFSRPN